MTQTLPTLQSATQNTFEMAGSDWIEQPTTGWSTPASSIACDQHLPGDTIIVNGITYAKVQTSKPVTDVQGQADVVEKLADMDLEDKAAASHIGTEECTEIIPITLGGFLGRPSVKVIVTDANAGAPSQRQFYVDPDVMFKLFLDSDNFDHLATGFLYEEGKVINLQDDVEAMEVVIRYLYQAPDDTALHIPSTWTNMDLILKVHTIAVKYCLPHLKAETLVHLDRQADYHETWDERAFILNVLSKVYEDGNANENLRGWTKALVTKWIKSGDVNMDRIKYAIKPFVHTGCTLGQDIARAMFDCLDLARSVPVMDDALPCSIKHGSDNGEWASETSSCNFCHEKEACECEVTREDNHDETSNFTGDCWDNGIGFGRVDEDYIDEEACENEAEDSINHDDDAEQQIYTLSDTGLDEIENNITDAPAKDTNMLIAIAKRSSWKSELHFDFGDLITELELQPGQCVGDYEADNVWYFGVSNGSSGTVWGGEITILDQPLLDRIKAHIEPGQPSLGGW